MKRIALALVTALCWTGASTLADTTRIATFNASLTRKGPGLLLRDLRTGKDPQIQNTIQIIQTVRPDILLINELDHDYENLALKSFLNLLSVPTASTDGITYPYFYAPPQNVGVPSGRDLNGDGRLGGPADAYGFGNFRGQYAMALVSRFPIDIPNIRNFTDLLWKQVPNAQMPKAPDGTDFPSFDALHVMRLSSKGHWDVPVTLPNGKTIHLLAAHPTPPVFDGPEDMNGKRNHSEIMFWDSYIKQTFDPNTDAFVILGDLNSDPIDGDSSHDAINSLLNAPYLQDPKPTSKGAAVASQSQGGANIRHKNDPAQDTADWRDTPGPGNLRVDYVLPSKSLHVKGAGVFWPAPDERDYPLIGSDGRASSDHRLVWVDLE